MKTCKIHNDITYNLAVSNVRILAINSAIISQFKHHLNIARFHNLYETIKLHDSKQGT